MVMHSPSCPSSRNHAPVRRFGFNPINYQFDAMKFLRCHNVRRLELPYSDGQAQIIAPHAMGSRLQASSPKMLPPCTSDASPSSQPPCHLPLLLQGLRALRTSTTLAALAPSAPAFPRAYAHVPATCPSSSHTPPAPCPPDASPLAGVA